MILPSRRNVLKRIGAVAAIAAPFAACSGKVKKDIPEPVREQLHYMACAIREGCKPVMPITLTANERLEELSRLEDKYRTAYCGRYGQFPDDETVKLYFREELLDTEDLDVFRKKLARDAAKETAEQLIAFAGVVGGSARQPEIFDIVEQKYRDFMGALYTAEINLDRDADLQTLDMRPDVIAALRHSIKLMQAQGHPIFSL